MEQQGGPLEGRSFSDGPRRGESYEGREELRAYIGDRRAAAADGSLPLLGRLRARREAREAERRLFDSSRRAVGELRAAAKRARREARRAERGCEAARRAQSADARRTAAQRAGVYRDVEALMRRQSRAESRRAEAWSDELSRAQRAQDLIGYSLMHEDGVCESAPGTFSETLSFSDINYRTASPEDQRSAFNAWCGVLNYFGPQVGLQLNAVSLARDEDACMRRTMLPETGGASDVYVREYNRMLADKAAESTQGITRERYLTVSVRAAGRDEALPLLARVRDDVADMLRRMGCDVRKLDGMDRLRLVRSQIAPDGDLPFDYGRSLVSGETTKDAVAPSSFDFSASLDPQGRFFRINNAPAAKDVFAQALVAQSWPSDLTDRALASITDLPVPLNVSVHYHAYDQGDAVAMVLKKLAWMRGEKARSQQQAFRQGLDPELGVSLEVQHRESEASDLLDDLRNRSQHLFGVSVVVLVWGGDLDELSSRVYQVTSAARKAGVRLSSYDLRQKRAFNSALPLGFDHVRLDRTFTTAEAAMLLPFSSRELMQEGGVYYGQNQLSGNPIIFNRKTLKTPAGFIFGKPGAGKGMNNKGEIFNARFGNPDDHGIIVDPKGEYGPCMEAWGGRSFELAVDSPHHINIFDLNENYSGAGSNPVLFKSEFLVAFFSDILAPDGGVTPVERSILDRCVRQAYSRWSPGTPPEDMPTVADFWNLLRAQPDPEADTMARALEMYVNGTLSCFAHTTDIDADAPWASWSTKRMGPQLAMAGSMAVMDRAWLHVTENEGRGVRTWVYIDEIQNFEGNPYAMGYLQKYFAEGRSYGLIPTGITQHPDRILGNDTFRQMLSSCEFQILLDQSYNNRMHLKKILSLSDTELGYIKDAEPGCGLLVAGPAVIPFRNVYPKGTALYRLMTTNPNEREAEARAAREEHRDGRA